MSKRLIIILVILILITTDRSLTLIQPAEALTANEWTSQLLTATATLENSSQTKALADALFKEANELYQAGSAEQALSKFTEAAMMYYQLGYSGNVALCNIAIARIYYDQGDSEKALQHFNLAWPVFRDIRYKEGEMLTYVAMTVIYEKEANYQEALEYYQRVLPLAHELKNPGLVAKTYSGMGGIYRRQGQYEIALEQYRQAMQVYEEIPDLAGEAETYVNMGNTYLGVASYEEALLNCQAGLSRYQELTDPAGEASAYACIGLSYRFRGEFQKALETYQKAQERYQQMIDGTGQVAILNNIGGVYSLLGDGEKALENYQLALAITSQIDDKEGMAASTNNIGDVYLRDGNYSEALDYFRKALEIYLVLGDSVGTTAAYDNLGKTFWHVENYSEALQNHQWALAIRSEIGDRKGMITSYGGIGNVYMSLGNNQEALDAYRSGLALAQEVGYRTGEATALNNMGAVYENMGDNVQAINYYRQALDITEAVQNGITIAELQESFAGGPWIDTYAHLVDLLWQAGDPEEAFMYVERARARAFLDTMAGGVVDFRAGVPANLLKHEEMLRSEIAALNQQLIVFDNHLPNEIHANDISAIQAELQEREADYAQLLVEIKLQSPEIADLVSVDVAPLAEIQNLLNNQTTLVEYFVAEEHTFAFIITRTRFDTVLINVGREDLRKTISSSTAFANKNDSHPAELKLLYSWLIAPIDSKLTTPVIGIIPHGPIHYLSFAALSDGKQFLNDKYVLFTLPSASVLRFIQTKSDSDSATMLAFGDPATIDPRFSRLRYAQKEAKDIAQLYETQPLIGPFATETALRSQAGNAGYLHVAAHGIYNEHNPLFSALLLASDNQNDGRLEVHEIYGLDLGRTNLVVLSACDTQLGPLSEGDELVSLTRAFFSAGAPTVVASLWKVNDEATDTLMERFYTNIRAGMGKAEALQAAQKEIRENPKWANPYYWAGFVLSGDPGISNMSIEVQPVAMSSYTRKFSLLCGSAVLFLILLFFLKSHLKPKT